MNIIFVLSCIGFFLPELLASASQNKTKRGLIHETHYYGETTPFRPAPLYTDNAPSQTQQQQGLPNYYTPKYPPQVKPNFEAAPKVTSQQVLYEYQQTPHNTVSNVHVNQQFHTIPVTEASYPQPYIQQPQNQYAASETVANPVQHSTYIHHTPYIPTQNPYLPAKYVYVNNKALYNPNPQQVNSQQIQSHSLHPQVVQPQQLHPLYRSQNIQQKLPIIPQQKLIPPPVVTPVTFQNYHHVEKTTPKPTEPPKKQIKEIKEIKVQEEEEEEDEEVDEAQEEDDESEDDESFDKYHFEDDEDDHAARYRDEEDDEDDDSERGSSTYKTQHKSRPKHTKYSTGYKEGYKTSKSNSGKKPSRKSHKDPRREYQAYSYNRGSNGKPKFESIEGKSSQNIPVTVQKVYREKWYITKNTQNKERN